MMWLEYKIFQACFFEVRIQIRIISDILSQNVSMALRAYSNYEVTKTLPEIGWRASKQFFQVSFCNYIHCK